MSKPGLLRLTLGPTILKQSFASLHFTSYLPWLWPPGQILRAGPKIRFQGAACQRNPRRVPGAGSPEGASGRRFHKARVGQMGISVSLIVFLYYNYIAFRVGCMYLCSSYSFPCGLRVFFITPNALQTPKLSVWSSPFHHHDSASYCA